MLAALAAIGVLSYPAWLVLHPRFDFPFHRIGERIGMLALLVGFILVARRAGLADRCSLGYGLPRSPFVREALGALAIGAVTMLLVVAIMTGVGLLDWSDAEAMTAGRLSRLLLSRLLSGLAVGLIEETFLRGAMFTAIARESGTRTAIILTALVYALTHFIGRYHIDAAAVNPHS